MLRVVFVSGGTPLWRFIDFVVTVRMPLFVMLKPFIQFKVCHLNIKYDSRSVSVLGKYKNTNTSINIVL